MTSHNLHKLTEIARDRGEPFKILIVDDEKWVREVFRDFCELSDAFAIDVAQSGNEAVQMVSDRKYDLVTMDLIMPEMSGLEALSSIKKISPRLPIMVITGNATDKLVNEAGVLGACRVMYKPVKLDDFLSEISDALMK